MQALPHMKGPKAIQRLLSLIQREDTPVRVTPEYLKRHQFANAQEVLAVLRAIGFTNKDNLPTNLWHEIRDEVRAPAAMAEAVRASYRVFFDAYQEPDKQSDSALGKILKVQTNFSNTDIQRTVATFRKLCEVADFGALQERVPDLPSEPRTISTEELDQWANHRSKVKTTSELLEYISAATRPSAIRLTEAVRCVEAGLHALAHVSAWNAFMEEALKGLDPGTGRLPEWVPDSQTVARLVERGLCSTSEREWLIPLLQRRNECAHVTDFAPTRDQALWYIGAIIEHIESLAGAQFPAGDRH